MRKNGCLSPLHLIWLFLLIAEPAIGGKGEKPTIVIPMVMAEGRLDIQFSGANLSVGAGKEPAPPGKCWKWVDPCPEDKKTIAKQKPNAKWSVYQVNPATNKGAPNTFWIVGPKGEKIEVDKKEKGGWRMTVSDAKEIKIANVKKSVWSVRLDLPENMSAQIIPEPPPMQQGCWVQVDCDSKKE